MVMLMEEAELQSELEELNRLRVVTHHGAQYRRALVTALAELEAKRRNAQAAASARQERDTLQRAYNDQREAFDGQREVIERLIKEKQELRKERDDLKDSYRDERDRADKLERLLRARCEEKDRLRKQNINLQHELAQVRGDLQEIKNSNLFLAFNKKCEEVEELKSTLHKERQNPLRVVTYDAMTIERVNNHSERLDELERKQRNLSSDASTLLGDHGKRLDNHSDRLHQLEEDLPQPNLPKGVHVQSIDLKTDPGGCSTTVTFSGHLDPQTCRKLWRGWD